MRNPSRNSIKRLMRRAFNAYVLGDCLAWNIDSEIHRKHSQQFSNYEFMNLVGAAAYNVSKGTICNREPKGYEKYLTPLQRQKLSKLIKQAEERNRITRFSIDQYQGIVDRF